MEVPTLVVSDPPHGEVDIEAAAKLLELDVFAAGLKVTFAAPEVMSASDPGEAEEFAEALRSTGFSVAVLDGGLLSALPWPDPVSTLAFDTSSLRGTVRNEGVTIPYDADVVGVYCRPPADTSQNRAVDLDRALASEHGPTIADAIQWKSIVDLYFRDEESLRRVTIVPDHLQLDGEMIVKELRRRFKRLVLDSRLAGVRPRARFHVEGNFDPSSERRRYSFGTLRLRRVLESIAAELAEAPQYELGSRLAYALDPLETATLPG